MTSSVGLSAACNAIAAGRPIAVRPAKTGGTIATKLHNLDVVDLFQRLDGRSDNALDMFQHLPFEERMTRLVGQHVSQLR